MGCYPRATCRWPALRFGSRGPNRGKLGPMDDDPTVDDRTSLAGSRDGVIRPERAPARRAQRQGVQSPESANRSLPDEDTP
jgi:hypothetical protein